MNQIIYVGKHVLTFSVVRHSHSSWELIYCTSGRGRMEFDNMSLSYDTGDVVVIPPLVPHINYSEEGFTNIHANLLDPSVPWREPMLFHTGSNQLVLNAFSGAFHQFSSKHGQQTSLLSLYGSLIVGHLLDLQEQPRYSRVVDEISNTIISSYPNCDFELDAYLHSLPFSYDYVRKLFKKELGVTPHKYLSDIRLQVAAQHLVYSGANGPNVTQVAHLCGFREPLYFSRMFKKQYGVSPSAYAEASQQAPESPPDSDSMKIML